MIDKQSLRIYSDFTRVDVLEGAEQKLEEFSTSYWDLFKRQRIIPESLRVRAMLPHNTLTLLVSTLEEQFPRTVFNPKDDNDTLHFLSLDQSVCPAVEKAIQAFLSKRTDTQRQPPHTKGITEQPTITLPMPYNRSLTVKKGDLVKEEVTAIVNAANKWLKHEGGVAYAINQVSHGQVQRESDQVIKDNWQHPIPTGQVAVTGAGGDLRCKAVIHAVGPDASVMKMDDCKQLLKQACESTLSCAEDKGMYSIALPPISSGIYAMPKDLVAQILIDTILQYPYRQGSSLKDIRIVIIDQQTLKPFLQYAQQVADSSPSVLPKASTTPSSSAPIPSSISDQPTITLPMPYNRSLTVKKGDLVKEEVTAIVNAANKWLKHEGGVAYAINQVSHGQVQKESDQVIKDNWQHPIPTGQVAVTGAGGDLRCKAVIHAVGPDASVMKMDDCKQLLKQACESTLSCAEDKGMHSIALPPISSGIYAMPKNLVAQILIDTILQYPYRQDSSLKDIRIVIIDRLTFMPFFQYAQQIGDSSPFVSSKASTTSPSLASVPSRITEQPTITLPMPYNRSLTVKKGDLVKEEVTAIVNAANGWLKHEGGVAYVINQASRGQVQRESDQLISRNWQRPIPTGQVAVTGAGGDLPCEAVIHAVGPDASVMKMDDCKRRLKQTCESTLHCAEDEGMHSIALPPISSGIYAMPKDLVAQILIDTILQYPYRQDSSLKDIRIVIIDQLTLMPFLQYAQKVLDSSQFVSPSNSTFPPTSAPTYSATQKSSSPPASSIPTSEVDVVEIPLGTTHRKLVLKKSHFIYEDADIKIAAICSEMGFTKGLNKNLNDQLKGQLQQTVDRRYQNGKPDKFDVFTVHCPPSTIGCRYLVVANILDNTLGSHQDHHKFLQQILHSVFKEADTLKMPSVAIVPNMFAISGFPGDTILPSFIRMFSQYQFTNDEFLTDVRFLATDDTGLAALHAAAERTVGRVLSLEQKSNPVILAPKFASPPDQSPGYGSKVAKIPSATVITGDISQYAADAIVVPVSPSLDMKGAISKAINSISKGAVLKYVTPLKGKLLEGNVIPIPCVEQWNIQSKYLFFLCRHQNTTLEILSQACKNALETAKSYHLQSIAFPPITSHQKKDLLAKTMMDVIKDFKDQNRGLLSVTIVVKKDDPIHNFFLQIMESTASHWE